MDFSAWSPSHLIVAALALATIIGQAIAVLARLKANTEQLQKQGEIFVHALERLEDRIDKRFEEVNQRFTEVNQQFTGMNQQFTGMNQRLTDMQAEIRDVRSEMRQLNQNHIDHLSHHER